ncbi:hypothetical protein [Psychroserpens sp.]|uniref:hypothetical protein n=1 Tax=Psychroserpens sp. TaxID=2020870 RepID=UPI001B1E4ECF|nr:hypothetical protein [Psychroserpens sp.]MBO6607660.1 hypothetical protein [Psychroserpens sp.]MBO6632516.1 hypothetical protein [Psychroserpens sp.]MBO6655028.1 hypothetical protein [Psychroserpens sp.]MBO6683167.1 hypothetical protein [Psychroserpens sp.]MBO6749654.1 hypothetical protein [Psychroserpens sp.]
MKKLPILLLLLICSSCIKERLLYLPEIQNSKISEIADVSHAYLFYDETEKDSVDLNRKNLIGTTNWLINVDKRLTLNQAIPNIIYLQNKKRNAKMHKNEDAKTYYTCNDTSIQNLGFIEFTQVFYHERPLRDVLNYKSHDELLSITLNAVTAESFALNATSNKINHSEVYQNLNDVISKIEEFYVTENSTMVYLLFDSELNFQDYIRIKSKLETGLNPEIQVSKDEFIY